MVIKTIEWSDRSKFQTRATINFLRENFSETVVEKFKLAIEKKIIYIAEYPTVGRKVHKTKTVQFVNFGKHYQLFYSVKGSTLFISSIFDTRQNPSKRPF
jgi:plasmid stabilization system protein ParE